MDSTQKDIVVYLEKDFITAIQNDLIAVLEFHEKQQTGGFHSIPREVFCYIDYVATLRYDPPNSSEKAIKFLEKYFAKSDLRYKHYGRLLYEMWRHGTVHEFDPKVLKHSTRKLRIGWLTNNDSKPENRACHLECYKVQGMTNTYVLTMNLFQLVDHLVEAIRSFTAELRSNKKLREKVQKNYNGISKILSVKELPLKRKRILNLQMIKAIKNQRLETDKNGRAIQ